MATTLFIRMARLLLAVWFAAGSLFPAALHPCHMHRVASPAPMHAVHDAHSGHARAPVSHAPAAHQCDCAQDCCGVSVATVTTTPDVAISASTALVVVAQFAQRTRNATPSTAEHRHPPAIGPPSALL